MTKGELEMDARGFMPKTKKGYLWYNQNSPIKSVKSPIEDL